MKFKEIIFQPLLPTGSFLNVRLGGTIELSDGDDPKAAAIALKQFTDELHQQMYPQLYKDGKAIFLPQGEDVVQVDTKTKQSTEEKLIQDIEKCTELTGENGLESYQILAQKSEATRTAYKLKYLQLNKK
jgi:hypothetical protein